MPRAYIEMILSSKPGKPPLVLGDQLRIEAGLAVTRHLQLDLAGVGDHRLLAVTVTPVAGLFVVILLSWAWQQFDILRHGYKVEEMQRERAAEEETARQLRLEIETLKSRFRRIRYGNRITETRAVYGTELDAFEAVSVKVRGWGVEAIVSNFDDSAFERFRGTAWMPEPCRSCERREVDWGGCRCQAFALTGDAARTDPACALSPHHELLAGARGEAEAAPLGFVYRQHSAASLRSLDLVSSPT